MIRRALAAALALALVIPGAALGVTNGGSTPETLVVDVTISMTAPTSATYTLSHPTSDTTYDSGTLSISNLTTNNIAGMRLDATTSAFTGPATVPTTTRSRDLNAEPSGVGWSATPNSARAVNFYATSATTDWLANRTTPTVTAGTQTIVMHAEKSSFSSPGTYSGTLSFVAATN